MKKALITGVSGQDGAFLAKLLLEKGYKVYGTSRDNYNMDLRKLKSLGVEKEIEYLSVAVNDFRSIFKTINEVRPNEIYNLSGQSSVGLSFEQPVDTFESIAIATLNILESIKMIDTLIKFYNAGSGECFGDTGEKIVTENDKFDFIYSFIVFQHVMNIECVENYLKEVSRTLKKDGLAVIYVGRPRFLFKLKNWNFLINFDYLIEKVLSLFGKKYYQYSKAKANHINLEISDSYMIQLLDKYNLQVLNKKISFRKNNNKKHGGQKGYVLKKNLRESEKIES